MTNKSDFGGQQTNFRPMLGQKQSELEKLFKSLAYFSQFLFFAGCSLEELKIALACVCLLSWLCHY